MDKTSEKTNNSNFRIEFNDKQTTVRGFFNFGRQINISAEQPLCLHKHENAFEFVIAKEGTFEFWVDNKTYSISGNEIFISLPDELHSSAKSPLTVGEFFWIQIDMSEDNNFLFLNHEAAETLKRRLYSINTHVIETADKTIVELCSDIYKMLIGENLKADKYKISNYVAFLIEKITEATATRKETVTDDIKKVVEYIKENIYDEISIDKLASYQNLSTTYFKLKFKAQMGISPGNFINKEKINLAKSLLMEGKSVTDVGVMLGFSTPSYFSQVFRKYTTMTPTQFLNENN